MQGRTPKRPAIGEVLRSNAVELLHNIGKRVHHDSSTVHKQTQELFDQHRADGLIGATGLHTEDMYDQTTAPANPRYPHEKKKDVSPSAEASDSSK